MKALYFDSVGGASGDMILAALIDLGAPLAELERQLASLGADSFKIQTTPARSHEIDGLQLKIQIVTATGASAHPAQAPARRLPDIEQLIEASQLTPRVKKSSLDVFKRLAEAEARIHQSTPQQVHFHEIGAMDSIIDIVGACLALELLGVDKVAVSPLPIGHGIIASVHGTLPAPAPATLALLQGMAVQPLNEPFELVTPTGAALLSVWSAAAGALPPGRLLRIGQGFGHHQLHSRPNLLRAMLLESDVPKSCADECLVLECNLDDSIPELLGSLLTALYAAGALDAFFTPLLMKKQRPGNLLTVLCHKQDRATLLDLIFKESTTFGIREYPVQRTTLVRRLETIATPYGKVRVKIGEWQGRVITRSPEHADCLKLAQQSGLPVRVVYEAAARTATKPD